MSLHQAEEERPTVLDVVTQALDAFTDAAVEDGQQGTVLHWEPTDGQGGAWLRGRLYFADGYVAQFELRCTEEA